jgi:bifunctional UDP-N-acetylglucosamine pyrophosphorylase/glucosamine-1-phosphate N-acetyltransferase
MTTQIVILAAGQSKRMQSTLPKVLHPLGGKPLLAHVIETVRFLQVPPPIIVYGFKGDQLKKAFAGYDKLVWVEQKEQLGSAHALQQALPHLHADRVLVLYGDVPLISTALFHSRITTTPQQALGMMTCHLSNPTHYGRIVRDERGQVKKIVEEKEATATERLIQEVNAGIYLIPIVQLASWLQAVRNDNAQGEYYLTDIIALSVAQGLPIHTVTAQTPEEVMGINDRMQLSALERYYQKQQAQHLMQQGVTLLDPARLDVRGRVKVASDVVIDVNVILEGEVTLGAGCRIGAGTILRDAVLGEGVEIKAYSIIEGATIAGGSVIGPFARLRPGTQLEARTHIGNFVEIKNSHIHTDSKVNHLSYIGDSDIGSRVNVGAGTITCNYDGAQKHRTVIGDDVHIGSDTQLIAPLIVEVGATIGAGSTVTSNVPPHQLTLTHELKQRTVPSWKRPEKHVESSSPVEDKT